MLGGRISSINSIMGWETIENQLPLGQLPGMVYVAFKGLCLGMERFTA